MLLHWIVHDFILCCVCHIIHQEYMHMYVHIVIYIMYIYNTHRSTNEQMYKYNCFHFLKITWIWSEYESLAVFTTFIIQFTNTFRFPLLDHNLWQMVLWWRLKIRREWKASKYGTSFYIYNALKLVQKTTLLRYICRYDLLVEISNIPSIRTSAKLQKQNKREKKTRKNIYKP